MGQCERPQVIAAPSCGATRLLSRQRQSAEWVPLHSALCAVTRDAPALTAVCSAASVLGRVMRALPSSCTTMWHMTMRCGVRAVAGLSIAESAREWYHVPGEGECLKHVREMKAARAEEWDLPACEKGSVQESGTTGRMCRRLLCRRRTVLRTASVPAATKPAKEEPSASARAR